MSEFKGTKGKWSILDNTTHNEKGDLMGCFQIETDDDNPNGSIVACQIYPYEFYNLTHEEAAANALLISKSPELLEMLKKWNSILDNDGYDNTEIEQLIKEATSV